MNYPSHLNKYRVLQARILDDFGLFLFLPFCKQLLRRTRGALDPVLPSECASDYVLKLGRTAARTMICVC
jgi:hypothetical protein